MACFKRLGKQVIARDFDRQVTELQVRASILNWFASLGKPATVRVASLRLGKGRLIPSRVMQERT